MKLLSLCLFLLFTNLQAEPLVIGIDEGKGTEIVRASVKLVERLSSLTGIELQTRTFPSLRLIETLSKGKIDGSLPNSEKVFESFRQQLIQVPRPVMHTQIYAYSSKPLVFTKLENLRSLSFLKVAGLKATNALLDQAGIKATEIQGIEKVLAMIQNGRADLVLIPDVFAQGYLQTHKDRTDKIIENRPQIADISAFLWLLEKHQALAKKFEDAIASLDRSGELAKLYLPQEIP